MVLDQAWCNIHTEILSLRMAANLFRPDKRARGDTTIHLTLEYRGG
jgi:hypothetical protein